MRINSYVSALVAAAHLQLASADPLRCARLVGGSRVHDPCGHRILPQVAVHTEAPASSVPAPVAAPQPTSISPAHPTGTVGATYSGPYYNYPKAEEWKHFDQLFDSFRPTMQVHSTPGAVDRLRISISKIGPEFGIPDNFILAIVMVESRGDVGVGDAADGQPTYGLMQAWGCPGYPGQHDLDQEGIDAQIRCGTAHFQQDMNNNAGPGPYERQVYHAMRVYNSGQGGLDPDDLGRGINPEYVTIIADYLTGRKTD